MHSPACCIDQDEFEEKIRVSKDARMKSMGKQEKELSKEAAADPIGDADKAGKRNFMETDLMWLRAVRLDPSTIFYLEDRAKNCYRLRGDLGSHNAVLNCFKDELRAPIDCECDIRKYLHDVSNGKSELAGEIAKHHKVEKEDNKGKKAKPTSNKKK